MNYYQNKSFNCQIVRHIYFHSNDFSHLFSSHNENEIFNVNGQLSKTTVKKNKSCSRNDTFGLSKIYSNVNLIVGKIGTLIVLKIFLGFFKKKKYPIRDACKKMFCKSNVNLFLKRFTFNKMDILNDIISCRINRCNNIYSRRIRF